MIKPVVVISTLTCIGLQVSAAESKSSIFSLSESSFSMGGFLEEEIAYSYQHDDFKYSKVATSAGVNILVDINPKWRAKVDLQTTYDAAYKIEGRDKFSEKTLDVYESDTRFNEVYTDIDVNDGTNIRIGRQYFSWGESYAKQISDIGNPRDLRELGLQNVKDLRLPVGATKLTFYNERLEFNLIAIPEIRPSELGAEGSEFDPFLSARRQGEIILTPEDPANGWRNTEFLSRLYLSNDWGDISFFAGENYNDFPVLNYEYLISGEQQMVLKPVYQKNENYGFFGNYITGSWQIKYDVAYSTNIAINRSAENIFDQAVDGSNAPVVSWENKDRLVWMTGVEYSGITDTQISVEYISERIYKHETTLLDEEHSEEVATFISRNFFNNTIATSLWWNHLVKDRVDLFRFDLSYDYTDNIKYFIGLNGVSTNNRSAYYYDYRATDRVSLGVKVTF